MSDNWFDHFKKLDIMSGNELLKNLKKLARQRGEHLEFIKKHGKGTHGTICLGSRCTTMKDRKKEIGKGLLKAMLEQLGVIKTSCEV